MKGLGMEKSKDRWILEMNLNRNYGKAMIQCESHLVCHYQVRITEAAGQEDSHFIFKLYYHKALLYYRTISSRVNDNHRDILALPPAS